MKKLAFSLAAPALAFVGLGAQVDRVQCHPPGATLARHTTVDTTTPASLNDVIMQYCVVCQNDVALTGNLSLQAFDVDAAAANPKPGSRPFQRLNRAEYAASVRALLRLEVDVGPARSPSSCLQYSVYAIKFPWIAAHPALL